MLAVALPVTVACASARESRALAIPIRPPTTERMIMPKRPTAQQPSIPSRREFLGRSAAVAGLATLGPLSLARSVHAAGSDMALVVDEQGQAMRIAFRSDCLRLLTRLR